MRRCDITGLWYSYYPSYGISYYSDSQGYGSPIATYKDGAWLHLPCVLNKDMMQASVDKIKSTGIAA
jgi:hypothetical protein